MSSLRKFKYDFPMILVDFLLLKDPDPIVFGSVSGWLKSPESSWSGTWSATLPQVGAGEPASVDGEGRAGATAQRSDNDRSNRRERSGTYAAVCTDCIRDTICKNEACIVWMRCANFSVIVPKSVCLNLVNKIIQHLNLKDVFDYLPLNRTNRKDKVNKI